MYWFPAPFVQGGEQKPRVVQEVSIHMAENGLVFMFFGTISEYLENKDFSEKDW